MCLVKVKHRTSGTFKRYGLSPFIDSFYLIFINYLQDKKTRYIGHSALNRTETEGRT